MISYFAKKFTKFNLVNGTLSLGPSLIFMEALGISDSQVDPTKPLLIISKNHPGLAGKVVCIAQSDTVLYIERGFCEDAVRFASLLEESRRGNFMDLPTDDRIWMMNHREHTSECPNCQGVMEGHKKS